MTEVLLQTPNFRALLVVGVVVMTVGLLMTLHGGAAYALLLWEWSAGVAAWTYFDPILGVFFFLAGAVQFPIATHLWGDPVREALRRLFSGPGGI
ncbi:MAG: hypothetical protein ABEI99_08350 [Halobaculum sp.]